MFRQLISIPCCNTKAWTISVSPFNEANIKGVLLSILIQCHKKVTSGIFWNKNNDSTMNNFGFKISLQLISIPWCDSKSLAISTWLFTELKINGVELVIRI